MTQINFTLSLEVILDLFNQSKKDAYRILMQEILNQILQAESTHVLQSVPYERKEDRQDYRNGTRERKLNTRIGRIELAVPRHRNEPFHSALFESYQRNEQALISTMMEMVIQGVSTRKVEKVTKELCGTQFSKSNVSELCKGLDESVQAFKNRPLNESYPFVMVDAMYIKVRENSAVRSKAVLIALGIDSDGNKEIIGYDVCNTESEVLWQEFFHNLKQRGLQGVDLVVSDQHAGLVAAVRSSFPNVAWQRCQFHFTRNIMAKIPEKHKDKLAADLREMFNMETVEEAREKRNEIVETYQMASPKAMETLDEGFEDSMNVMCLPLKYRKILRTTNILERENMEIRRREDVIRIFPNLESAIRMIGAILQDHNESWQLRGRIFNMENYFVGRKQYKMKLRGA